MLIYPFFNFSLIILFFFILTAFIVIHNVLLNTLINLLIRFNILIYLA